MSDKGLSDEAAAAACKDGDPLTKVSALQCRLEFNFTSRRLLSSRANPTGH